MLFREPRGGPEHPLPETQFLVCTMKRTIPCRPVSEIMDKEVTHLAHNRHPVTAAAAAVVSVNDCRDTTGRSPAP